MEQTVQHLLASAGGQTRRLEVLEGPTGRRRWPDAVKAAIVAESFEPGAKVNTVARRHGLSPQHLTGWRRLAREGQLVLPSHGQEPSFARLVVGEPPVASPAAQGDTRSISIETDGIVMRVAGEISVSRPGKIVRVLRLA